MTKRWTNEEEKMLLKNVALGKSYNMMSNEFGRSENALELRVKKIIYDNISNKKSVNQIGGLLNMPNEKVMQYYYSYKDHLERENKLKPLNTLNAQNTQLSENPPRSDGIRQIQQNQIKNDHIGGGINNDLKKLEYENAKMKLLLENYKLKHKLSKIIKSDKNTYKYIVKSILE